MGHKRVVRSHKKQGETADVGGKSASGPAPVASTPVIGNAGTEPAEDCDLAQTDAVHGMDFFRLRAWWRHTPELKLLVKIVLVMQRLTVMITLKGKKQIGQSTRAVLHVKALCRKRSHKTEKQ